MRRAVAAIIVAASSAALASPDAYGANAKPLHTPVIVSPLAVYAPPPVTGTDGFAHVLYELQLVNTQSVPVPVQRVEVVWLDPRGVLAVYEGAELASRLRTLDNQAVAEAVIAPSSQLVLFVDLVVSTSYPLFALQHKVTLGATARTAATTFNTARLAFDEFAAPRVVGSPVDGANWVVTAGCCSPQSQHRAALLPSEIGLSVAPRYAMDFRQMDEEGRFYSGDPSQLTSYAGYGAYALAVGAGRVVDVVDRFGEQAPGIPAPIGTFGPDEHEGNYVVIDLGERAFAYYGQLMAGSIIVRPGDHVRRGQPIARIGNSGDSGAPHLHFHLMNGESVLGSDGIPFVLNRFGYAGQVDAGRFAREGLEGAYADDRLPISQSRQRQLPLDLAILDFVANPGATGNPLA